MFLHDLSNLQFLEKVSSLVHFDYFFRASMVLWHCISEFAKRFIKKQRFKKFSCIAYRLKAIKVLVPALHKIAISRQS